MTFLAAPIWNQIAREEELETEAGKIAFSLTDRQMAVMDQVWRELEDKAGTPAKVARCLPTCLPLVAESFSVQAWVSQHPMFRGAIPELLDAQEAALVMQQEWRLSDAESETLQTALSSLEAMDRWHQAALQASQTPA